MVTITDEMTRQQKVYSDVLGRQWKTEVLNWDGTVYSTIETTLNARDQATLARQFQGTNQSGVYQDTGLDYDGYGRLWKKHRSNRIGVRPSILAILTRRAQVLTGLRESHKSKA